MNFNAVWFPNVNIVGMHKIVTVIFFSLLPKIIPVVTTLILKKLIKSYTPSHYRREVSGLWANSENHDGFRNLFTALIESSWRHVTGRVTKGNHSLEIRSVLENNELLTTTLFLIFGIVYHPLKIAPAIRWNMLLHKCFGRYRLYVMAIHEYLTRSSQFVRHWVTYFVLRHATNIIKSKLSTWKK